MNTPLKHLFRPAKNTENPKLLLLLHGYGSNEQDLFSFAEELPEDFFVISLRAPKPLPFGGYAWYDINFENAQKFNDTEQAQEAIQLIRDFIAEAIDEYDLCKEEVWLCGFSQGAILSNALTLQDPQNIRRVIMLSGYYAEDIVGDISSKNHGKEIAYFVSHGTEDTVIPIEWARKTPAFLESYGVDCTFKEYRSGHGLVPQNFHDMIAWIEDKK